MELTIEYLKQNNLIIFECLTGSKAYGTDEEDSDTDIKGIFILPIDMCLRGEFVEDVSDEKHNTTYFEIGKFMEMLSKSNPTAIELLFSPESIILYKNPVMDDLLKNKNYFLNKNFKDSFGKYAASQISKARGLKKKIVNEMPKEKKSPIDFCYVIDGYKSYPLTLFLEKNGLNQKFCGLVNIPHANYIYSLFYDEFSHVCFDESIPLEDRERSKNMHKNSFKGYKGIVKEDENNKYLSNEIRMSSIPKTETPKCVFYYNKDGYTKFCKDHLSYWDWVCKRNQARYNNNIKINKNYDAKNLGHCVRLLNICIEIGEGKGVIIRRPDREELLKIKHGQYSYEELMLMADKKLNIIEDVYSKSTLPDNIDPEICKKHLLQIRKDFYKI